MSKKAIEDYYKEIEKTKKYGGKTESSLRRHFANLLQNYCNSKKLQFLDEEKLEHSNKRPDGTIKNEYGLKKGFWESKGSKVNLDDEIDKKVKIYPTNNILFENSKEIVLIQNDKEVMRCKMENAERLHSIIKEFVSYESKEITEFRVAIEKFREDIPNIINALRKLIKEQINKNNRFKTERENFWKLCKNSISPRIKKFDINEMLIQHILTQEIFDAVFDESHFHRENNIAKSLEKVIKTFFTGELRRNMLMEIESYYKAIRANAATFTDHNEKQKFLKIIYENFYKAYNPKGADRLGIVYTPNEIVEFMIKSTDFLLQKYFSKLLHDENVQILDPATGTGTFVTEIINYIDSDYLASKYKKEIHCNEIAILPYYIANLNIEVTYKQKMQKYKPFKNIVFVDTLENVGLELKGEQKKIDFYKLSAENLERIKNQNKKKISVIIGNPPYNANQKNENQNNKNKDHFNLDNRIADTYVKFSKAQKTKVYDPYAKFYRWATDRIEKNGIIAFITNRSFIDSKTFDGFRKAMADEFNYIYIIDLQGDVRNDRSQVNANVFGIQTGVAIAFFIRKEKSVDKYIKYFSENSLYAKDKLNFLEEKKIKDLTFKNILPDKHNNWIDIPNNDFDSLLPVASKKVKNGNGNKHQENAVFKLFSLGIISSRDDWVYDFNKRNLSRKIKFFIQKYNEFSRKKDDSWNIIIKWSRDVKKDLLNKKKYKYDTNKIVDCFYRPFVKKKLYYSQDLNEMQYKTPLIFGKNSNLENIVININYQRKDLYCLVTNCLSDLHFVGDNQCLPFYRYENGSRVENITDWGLLEFINHYEDKKITKMDIFHYIYGVLHNPAYRNKYALNFKRDFPRIPFYKDFWKWKSWGAELMDLHINYEKLTPYQFKVEKEKQKIKNPKPRFKINKVDYEIELDEVTTLKNIPRLAFEYKLGSRSAIEWVISQYKEKKIKDKTISKKFNPYKFNYIDTVSDLLGKVVVVSVRTMEIVSEMKKESF